MWRRNRIALRAVAHEHGSLPHLESLIFRDGVDEYDRRDFAGIEPGVIADDRAAECMTDQHEGAALAQLFQSVVQFEIDLIESARGRLRIVQA